MNRNNIVRNHAITDQNNSNKPKPIDKDTTPAVIKNTLRSNHGKEDFYGDDNETSNVILRNWKVFNDYNNGRTGNKISKI